MWLILFFCLTSMFPEMVKAEDKVVRVAFDQSLPPFSSVEPDGEYTGFTLDLIRAIALQNDWQLEYVPLEWEEAVDALRTGEVDVLLGMKYTNRFDQIFDFSESFFTMSEVLLVPRDDQQIYTLNQLSEKVVAVQRAHTSMDLLESVRRVKMLVSFSQTEALANLTRGRADAFIGNRWTAEYMLRKENRWDDFTMRSGLINPTDYAFAVREGHSELLDKLNEGLNQLYRDGSYTRLYSHYFEPYSPHLTDWWRKLVIGLLLVLAVGIISLLAVFMWNKRLKAEVRRRTAELADVMVFQQKVLDHTDSAIFSLDVQGNITLVNQVAFAMLPRQREMLGRHILDVFPQLPWDSCCADRGRHYEGDIHDDDTFVFHYYMAPFHNAMAEHVGWIVTVQDRTEQKRMQTRLISQEKMRALGQLVAGIAHELRNPLTAVKTFIELLPKKVDDPRFRSELLRYVPEELERMNRIVEELLDYSRSKPLLLQNTNVAKLVHSVVGLLARRFESEQVNVVVDIAEKLEIQVDRGRIKQVLLNLVLNALEAMASRPVKQLRIKAGAKKDGLWISISDTGEGMQKEQQVRLFEPFYTTKAQGIGLGLYVSQKIMREHHGLLEVSSVTQVGTTFTLRFGQEDRHAEAVNR